MRSLCNGDTAHPLYQAEQDLRVLDHGGKKVAINPELGTWAVVSREELAELLNPTGYLSAPFGEEAYLRGLARKNGHGVYGSDAQTDQLFFFEFHVSDQCNLACAYCSAATQPVRRIAPADPAIGRKWIDRIVEHCSRHGVRCVDLEFTGGEPLANVDFLDCTLDYAWKQLEERRIKADATVVSNMTLLGVRQIEFLRKHPLHLSVSLDGDAEDHNGHRPFAAGGGSHTAVLKNISRLKALGMPPKAIQSTVTCRTVEHMPRIAQHLLEAGFTQLSLQHVYPAGILGDAFALMPDPKVYVDKLFETLETQYLPFWRRTGVMPHSRHLALAYAYLLEPKRAYMCQRAPCGAGRTIMAVKPNGDAYGCAIAPWIAEFRYGNILEQSFEECQQSPAARASFGRVLTEIPGCSGCLYRGWCQAGCPKDAFARHGTIMAPSGLCALYRELWQRALFSLVDELYPEPAIRRMARSYLK